MSKWDRISEGIRVGSGECWQGEQVTVKADCFVGMLPLHSKCGEELHRHNYSPQILFGHGGQGHAWLKMLLLGAVDDLVYR